MKRTKRAAIVLLVCLLVMQLLTITASADLGYYFTADVSTKYTKNGASCTVKLYGAGGETGSALDALIQECQPYVQVTRNEEIYQEVSITKASDATEILVEEPGEWQFMVYDRYGTRAMDAQDPSMVAGGLVVIDGIGAPADDAGDPLAELYAAGVRFLVEMTENEDSVTLSLSGINVKNASDFQALVKDLQPAAVLYRYFDEPEKNNDTTEYFQAGSGTTAQLTLDLQGAIGYELNVEAQGEYDSVYAYFPEKDYYDTAFWMAGEVSGTDGVNTSDDDAFQDISPDAWYAEYVYTAADLGLVNGKGQGKFAPDDNMTYAEAITLASRLFAITYGTEIPTAGDDVWYQPYLDYAKTNNIPWQYPDYDGKITREDYVHIFYAAMPEETYYPINSVADGAVPDVSMSHKYADEIYSFYRAGIVGGSDKDRNFLPVSNIRRSEVAAILCRMYLDMDRQVFILE